MAAMRSGRTARMATRETPEPILEYESVRLRAYFRVDEAEYWGVF